MELTILMPCLNEAETLEVCIRKAQSFLRESGVVGEVLIADNGSTDGSPEIAERCGARVVHAAQRGYGNALICGCEQARGTYVIMGDADDSYDFEQLMPFVTKLREGCELVMGDRFRGGIADGAMPWLHRYIGNPVLSFIGRLFYHSQIRDFHCGLRGYRRESVLGLGLRAGGMEYASEMVVKAELAGLRIAETPTTLKKDGRSHAPHLRSFRDGWRHLKFLYSLAPKWLFLYPSVLCLVLGAGFGLRTLFLTGTAEPAWLRPALAAAFLLLMGLVGLDCYELHELCLFYGPALRKNAPNRNAHRKEDRFIFGGLITAALSTVCLIFGLVLNKEAALALTLLGTLGLAAGLTRAATGFLAHVIKGNFGK